MQMNTAAEKEYLAGTNSNLSSQLRVNQEARKSLTHAAVRRYFVHSALVWSLGGADSTSKQMASLRASFVMCVHCTHMYSGPMPVDLHMARSYQPSASRRASND